MKGRIICMKSFLKYPDIHPADYIKKQISPVIKKDKDFKKEIVWTYLVARKYKDDYEKLAEMLGVKERIMPEVPLICLEANLQPTREKEFRSSWSTRADLAIGHFEFEKGTKRKKSIQSNGREWICIAESKWYDKGHFTKTPEKINQLLKIIEHALLLHDDQGRFPHKVYMTLVTPRYFKERTGKFSHRYYSDKYEEYKEPAKLEKDLKMCRLPFLKHNIETLISRTNALVLNWITFEELLRLPNLVEDRIPDRYKVTFDSWEEVFIKMGRMDIYKEMLSETQ
jgi:hypothetical protein